MARTTAGETLVFRIDPLGDGRAGVLRGIAAALRGVGRGDGAPSFEAVLARRSSGAVVLRGPVEPGLRRFLVKAVEGDLASKTEAEFLAAWGGGGSWADRYERWRERGWVPPVR